jgi:hypothetical protein
MRGTGEPPGTREHAEPVELKQPCSLASRPDCGVSLCLGRQLFCSTRASDPPNVAHKNAATTPPAPAPAAADGAQILPAAVHPAIKRRVLDCPGCSRPWRTPNG